MIAGMGAIGFLHTAQVHVATFDALTAGRGVEARHVVEPDLLDRARRDGPTEEIAADVRAALAALVDAGADVVVCTCSTLGPIAEGAELSVPVLRVDRPMARAAVAVGPRIAVVAAVESTVGPTRALLLDEARRAGRGIELTEVVVPDAWDSFEAGHLDGYRHAIARAARRAAAGVDVVVLAQASMAPALDDLADLVIPVLCSPALAVAHAMELVD